MADFIQLKVKRRQTQGGFLDLLHQLRNKQGDEAQLLFDIRQNGKYAGAMATLRPLVEIDVKAAAETPAELESDVTTEEPLAARAVAVGETEYFSDDFMTLNMTG